MREYIYAVTGAVLLSEMCMMLMPEGGMKRFAKTAVGVMVMMMLLLPLQRCSQGEFSVKNFFSEEPSAYKTSYSDIIMDIYTRAMENGEVETDGEEIPEP